VEGAQSAVGHCEVLQYLFSSEVDLRIVFFLCFELFNKGVIEKVTAASVHITPSVFTPQFKGNAFRFWQRSQDVAPLTLWMASTILMATKRFWLLFAFELIAKTI
jgi:hypothetical protein